MWDDVELVTLQQAKDHAGITDNDRDDDLSLKLEEAHGLVLDYISRPDDDWTDEMLSWDGDSAPRPVRAAVFAMFAYLVRFRGDDDPKPAMPLGGKNLPDEVAWRLARYRDPALA